MRAKSLKNKSRIRFSDYPKHWPGFDYVKWNRGLVVASIKDTQEVKTKSLFENCHLEWVDMELKMQKSEIKVNKITALLNKIGI